MELNPIFSSRMVLQAGKPIRIFGTGDGHVSVSFCGDISEADSAEGKWLAELPAREYGGPYEMKIVDIFEFIEFKRCIYLLGIISRFTSGYTSGTVKPNSSHTILRTGIIINLIHHCLV
jgi:hypothetical protein